MINLAKKIHVLNRVQEVDEDGNVVLKKKKKKKLRKIEHIVIT